MDEKDIQRKLLETIDLISSKMSEIILNNYFDKLGNEKKYVLSLFNDAFNSAEIICYAISKVAIIQAGMIIRHLLENVSIIKILVENDNLLSNYIKFYKFRVDTVNLDDNKRKEKAITELGLKKRINPKSFIDYGWIEGLDDYSEESIVKYAGFEDIEKWRKVYLNKMVHGSYNNVTFFGEEYDLPIINNLIDILLKLFDFLCCFFHKYTDYDFNINNKNMFLDEFRIYYKKYMELKDIKKKEKKE